MSVDIVLALIVLALVGVLLDALTPRGLDHFEDAVRLPILDKRPYGQGEEGR